MWPKNLDTLAKLKKFSLAARTTQIAQNYVEIGLLGGLCYIYSVPEVLLKPDWFKLS